MRIVRPRPAQQVVSTGYVRNNFLVLQGGAKEGAAAAAAGAPAARSVAAAARAIMSQLNLLDKTESR